MFRLVVAVRVLLVVAVAATEVSTRNLRKKYPSWYKRYRQVIGEHKLQICSEEPTDGARCPDVPDVTDEYYCMFGEQVCESGFTHPAVACKCIEDVGSWSCGEWIICDEDKEQQQHRKKKSLHNRVKEKTRSGHGSDQDRTRSHIRERHHHHHHKSHDNEKSEKKARSQSKIKPSAAAAVLPQTFTFNVRTPPPEQTSEPEGGGGVIGTSLTQTEEDAGNSTPEVDALGAALAPPPGDQEDTPDNAEGGPLNIDGGDDTDDSVETPVDPLPAPVVDGTSGPETAMAPPPGDQVDVPNNGDASVGTPDNNPTPVVFNSKGTGVTHPLQVEEQVGEISTAPANIDGGGDDHDSAVETPVDPLPAPVVDGLPPPGDVVDTPSNIDGEQDSTSSQNLSGMQMLPPDDPVQPAQKVEETIMNTLQGKEDGEGENEDNNDEETNAHSFMKKAMETVTSTLNTDSIVGPDLTGSSGVSGGVKSWPEMVGKTCHQARILIQATAPEGVHIVSCFHPGAEVTDDVRSDRVRIFLDEKGVVKDIPFVG